MKKLFLLLLFPIVSFGQSPYSSYYKKGKTKETGSGYTEKIKHKVSAKNGLNLRESPDLKSNKIGNIPYDTVLYVVDKTGIKLTLIDTDKETGSIEKIEGEWVEIDNSDMFDDLKGYIFSGFTEKEKYSEKQSGYWTGYYESGVIKEEILIWGDGGEIRKKITYDTDGDITRIEEHEGDDWGRHISVTFHENGNIKYLKESESGGAISIKFDKRGNIIANGWGCHDGYKCLHISKDIRVLNNKNKYRECVVKTQEKRNDC